VGSFTSVARACSEALNKNNKNAVFGTNVRIIFFLFLVQGALSDDVSIDVLCFINHKIK
jgi:hypothetical protein